MVQARRKVLKVGGAIALEPAKGLGAKRRAMYLNLEIPLQKRGACAHLAPTGSLSLIGVLQGAKKKTDPPILRFSDYIFTLIASIY